MTKIAAITGITGQDGSLLADILLERGYTVHGLHRRSSTGNFTNIQHILQGPQRSRFHLHQGDVTDHESVYDFIDTVRPDEVYHEADQDNVDWSFNTAVYSVDVTLKGTLNVLAACRRLLPPTVRIFIPCSATVFGDAQVSQNETTPFNPQSPYACAKAAVYHHAQFYRQVYGMDIRTGILYNHDSVRRHGDYLLHRIVRAALKCRADQNHRLRLWGLDEFINVGRAEDFMKCVTTWMSLELPIYHTLCIGNAQTYDVLSVALRVFERLGMDGHERIEQVPQNRPGTQGCLRSDCNRLKQTVGAENVPQADIRQLIIPLICKYS